MEKSINSDDTMAASEMFDIILSQIQRSSLNFRLQVSPYSAVISLKKSLVKDKFGTPILKSSFKNESGVYPCSESSEAKFKIQTLEAELYSLKQTYGKVQSKLADSYQTIDSLGKNIVDRDKTIKDLEISNKISKAAAEKLNARLVEQVNKYEKEKMYIIADCKHEIKMWKKELGAVNKKHIKLQKKFENLHSHKSVVIDCPQEVKVEVTSLQPLEPKLDYSSQIVCSICARHIENYVPEYFCGETFNPACEKCKADANLDIGHDLDPFSSFPIEGMPISLVSHWILPYYNATPSLLAIPSLRAHYTMLPNPGSSFISMEEVLAEFKKMMDEQLRELKESFKIT